MPKYILPGCMNIFQRRVKVKKTVKSLETLMENAGKYNKKNDIISPGVFILNSHYTTIKRRGFLVCLEVKETGLFL